MKNLGLPLGVIALITLLGSCEIETPPRYFDVNGERNKLNVAFADDWGPSSDLSYRTWAISLRSEEIMPGSYITFMLGSYENQPEITQGNYKYSYEGGKGNFTEISIGYNLSYDYKGYPIGTRLNDVDADFSGNINFDGQDNKFYLNINLEVSYNSEIYTITGEYEGKFRIDEGVVDPSNY
jgi:hypothetical protein